MSPPLVVTEAEMDTAVRIFSEAIAAVSSTERAVHDAAAEAGALNEVEAGG
jgi:hypothetical protein